ncbi:MAG: hypothetical protein JXX29_22345 [Deltaproteobacteria bacterium]|nr:hypothetical protein [Deltaproteobacteria bacterium]MBN2674438.1 hypothetical protein [Deltaproteobacteria bacterium]
MKDKIAYRLPYVVMAVLGLFMLVQYYIPHSAVQTPKALLLQWKQPLNGFIILLAILGIATAHIRKVYRQERRWGYSIITLVSMAAMIFMGFVFGVQDGTVFSDWFKYLISPIEATMFSLLAFFVGSAAFRAFRARSVSATVLLVSATLVMLALIPVVAQHIPLISDVSEFILKYPNTAAKRAILIGVSLGAISVALKTIFGIDKTLLEREGR